ncbi:SRP54-type protein [Umbelopsis sp. PMI_123]|nr:SRP54-type protein [Umbelopsis sp. PMI_123]
MLDLCTVLTKGGYVLWQKNYTHINGAPVDALIRDVLIEERAGITSYNKDSYALKWTFLNEKDLVFVIAYQSFLQLTYVDELLETTKRLFSTTFKEQLESSDIVGEDYSAFDPLFDRAWKTLEEKYSKNRQKVPRKFEDTKKYENTLHGSKAKPTTKEPSVEDEIAKNIQAMNLAGSPRSGARGPAGRRGVKSPKGSPAPSPNMASDSSSGKKKKSQKVMRTWEGSVAKGEMEALDYSKKLDGQEQQDANLANAESLVDRSKMGSIVDGHYEVQDVDYGDDDEDDTFDEEDGELVSQSTSKSSGVFSFFKNLTGQREIDAATLEPVLQKMKTHLIDKNVASNISQHLCDSVQSSLLGKKLGTFGSVSTLVKENMESALKRILTPKTSVDILRDIEQAKAQSRPYSITFIGVNGVGKSTNLSKVCFWLLQNNYRVLIAACDTFRSGAVEQLRVHARNLKVLQSSNSVGEVELFERGYGKDAAGIAQDAVSYAKNKDFDVVLIDTAGRMQDNEPLMRSLAKLVAVNNPDKIIFVGEALVGNEAVDQLTKFNQALKDFSGLQNPRHIDGMILTKFDTIDDKVGAALSMTYTTGQPIYFVGTGQTYTDLKNLKVSHVVQSLLKN